MKRLVLLGLILLISMTTVLAATTFYPLNFHDSNIVGAVQTFYQRGYYKWGAYNGAPEVKIEQKLTKVFTAYSVKNQETTATCDAGMFWSSGEIKFNTKIPVDSTTRVTYFQMKFTPRDRQSTSIWTYRINATEVNDPSFYVTRISENEYEITCEKVYLNTIVYNKELGWVHGNAPWNIKATLTI